MANGKINPKHFTDYLKEKNGQHSDDFNRAFNAIHTGRRVEGVRVPPVFPGLQEEIEKRTIIESINTDDNRPMGMSPSEWAERYHFKNGAGKSEGTIKMSINGKEYETTGNFTCDPGPIIEPVNVATEDDGTKWTDGSGSPLNDLREASKRLRESMFGDTEGATGDPNVEVSKAWAEMYGVNVEGEDEMNVSEFCAEIAEKIYESMNIDPDELWGYKHPEPDDAICKVNCTINGEKWKFAWLCGEIPPVTRHPNNF